jgi:hypothetical protein
LKPNKIDGSATVSLQGSATDFLPAERTVSRKKQKAVQKSETSFGLL